MITLEQLKETNEQLSSELEKADVDAINEMSSEAFKCGTSYLLEYVKLLNITLVMLTNVVAKLERKVNKCQ